MNKIYIKEVDSCKNCPALSHDDYSLDTENNYCTIHEKLREIADINLILDDCPLENAIKKD